jgi:ribulose-5-phosphate 4-epimerase/fuculose-1-phosphate aldolase
MVNPAELLERTRAEIVEVGRRLYGRGLVGGAEGNISEDEGVGHPVRG